MKSSVITTFLTVCFILLMALSLSANDKPMFKFDWYGSIKLDASFDQLRNVGRTATEFC
jgi:hypothetical protein